MATNNTPTKTAARKAAPKPTPQAAKHAAAKAKAQTSKTTAKTATVEAKAPKVLDAQTVKALKAKQAKMLDAIDAFEQAIADELRAGSSPTHVGAAVELASSSIRRIGWRLGVGEPPASA
jgi:hypothetical protein